MPQLTPCPLCGHPVEHVRALRDGGCIEEEVFCIDGRFRRKVRPCSFYACMACDWCSVSAPEEKPK